MSNQKAKPGPTNVDRAPDDDLADVERHDTGATKPQGFQSPGVEEYLGHTLLPRLMRLPVGRVVLGGRGNCASCRSVEVWRLESSSVGSDLWSHSEVHGRSCLYLLGLLGTPGRDASGVRSTA